jgi:hypothetical protein
MSTTEVLAVRYTVTSDTAADLVCTTAADFRAACRLYRRLYGVTWYNSHTRALTVRAHRIRAVMTPPDLGAATQRALDHRPLQIITLTSGI